MTAAIVAAAAALAGVLLQALVTDWRARAERRRRELAAAVSAVLGAAVRLRNRQYLKHVAPQDSVQDAPESRQGRYDARSDLTAAVDAIYLSSEDPQLLTAVQAVFDTAVALGDASTQTEIDAAGLRARQAHTALRHAGAKALHGSRPVG